MALNKPLIIVCVLVALPSGLTIIFHTLLLISKENILHLHNRYRKWRNFVVTTVVSVMGIILYYYVFSLKEAYDIHYGDSSWQQTIFYLKIFWIFSAMAVAITSVRMAILHFKKQHFSDFCIFLGVVMICQFLIHYIYMLTLGLISWPLITAYATGHIICLTCFVIFMAYAICSVLQLLCNIFKLCICKTRLEKKCVANCIYSICLSCGLGFMFIGMRQIIWVFNRTLFDLASSDFSNLFSFSSGLILTLIGVIVASLMKILYNKMQSKSEVQKLQSPIEKAGYEELAN